MTKYVLLIIYIVIYFYSCKQNNCTQENRFLSKCRFKYWDAYNKGAQNPFGLYRLDVDGSCYYLKYNYDTKPPNTIFFYQEDIVGMPNRWKENTENRISLVSDNWMYKIVRKERDTLELISTTNGDSIILVTSIQQKDQFNFDSLKKCKGTPYYYKK